MDRELKARAPEAGVVVELRTNVPPFAPERDGAAEAFARRLAGDNGPPRVVAGSACLPLPEVVVLRPATMLSQQLPPLPSLRLQRKRPPPRLQQLPLSQQLDRMPTQMRPKFEKNQ